MASFRNHSPAPVRKPVLRMPEPKETDRTSAGLRVMLFEEIDNVRNGRTTARVANAIARLSDQVIRSVALEIDAERLKHDIGEKGQKSRDFMPPTLQLGERDEDRHEIEEGSSTEVEGEVVE